MGFSRIAIMAFCAHYLFDLQHLRGHAATHRQTTRDRIPLGNS